MLLPLRFIPELRDLPARERRRLWRQALNDPFTVADSVRVLVLLAGAVVIVVLPVFRLHLTSGLGFLSIFIAFSLLIDLMLIQRYRPVLKRCRERHDVIPEQDPPLLQFARILLFAVVMPLMAWSVIQGVHRSWEQGTSTRAQWFCGSLLLLLLLSAYIGLLVGFLRRRRRRPVGGDTTL